MNYSIGDCVIRIKNAYLGKRREAVIPYSRINKTILELLVREGFLRGAKEEVRENKKILVASLRYERRIPVFTDVSIVSKPSLRVYARSKLLKSQQKKGLGVGVISTNQGILTEKEAGKKGIGGELLFRIW